MRKALWFSLKCLILVMMTVLFLLPVSAEGESYPLDWEPADFGSLQVTVGGTAVTGPTQVKPGTEVVFTAVPQEGYYLRSWESSAKLGENVKLWGEVLKFAMPASPVTVEGIFHSIEYYQVTVEESVFGSCVMNSGLGTYLPGAEEVRLRAKADAGYRFVRWIDQTDALNLSEEAAANPELIFLMPESDVTLSMEFEPIPYTFKIEIDGDGEVEVEGKEPDEEGFYSCQYAEDVILIAKPDEESVFVRWTTDGNFDFDDPESEATSFSCPAEDFTVTVHFSSNVMNLTVSSTDGGKVLPEEGTIRFGVENIYELEAVSDRGYEFDHWECSSEKGKFSNAKSSKCSFTMPDEDCIVTAVFKKGQYRLTLLSSAGGSVEGAEGSYEMGSTVAIRAIPADGYVFSRWETTGDSSVLADPRVLQTSVTIPGEDVKITAVFILAAALNMGGDDLVPEEEGGFPWIPMIVILFVSLVAVGLIMIRDRYRLSYGYLIRKAFSSFFKN